MNELTDRTRVALLWLDEKSEPLPPNVERWRVPKRTALAFQLADHFRVTLGRAYHDGEVTGAANTLVALKRRGFAANDGGGAWVQARWWITAEGRAKAKELRDEHNR